MVRVGLWVCVPAAPMMLSVALLEARARDGVVRLQWLRCCVIFVLEAVKKRGSNGLA